MIARNLTLALSILVLSANSNAFASEFNFLKRNQVELPSLYRRRHRSARKRRGRT